MAVISAEEIQQYKDEETKLNEQVEEARKAFEEAKQRYDLLTRKRAAFSSFNLQLNYIAKGQRN
jgi:hypothetical protein